VAFIREKCDAFATLAANGSASMRQRGETMGLSEQQRHEYLLRLLEDLRLLGTGTKGREQREEFLKKGASGGGQQVVQRRGLQLLYACASGEKEELAAAAKVARELHDEALGGGATDEGILLLSVQKMLIHACGLTPAADDDTAIRELKLSEFLVELSPEEGQGQAQVGHLRGVVEQVKLEQEQVNSSEDKEDELLQHLEEGFTMLAQVLQQTLSSEIAKSVAPLLWQLLLLCDADAWTAFYLDAAGSFDLNQFQYLVYILQKVRYRLGALDDLQAWVRAATLQDLNPVELGLAQPDAAVAAVGAAGAGASGALDKMKKALVVGFADCGDSLGRSVTAGSSR